ncbi:MAG: Rha family transcriptional regulator [Roseiarcus sp.]
MPNGPKGEKRPADVNARAAVPLTMSSLEIAGLTGKRHNNVLRDIDGMLAALDQPALSFERSVKDGSGKTIRAFSLPKRETLILVSGYLADFNTSLPLGVSA